MNILSFSILILILALSNLVHAQSAYLISNYQYGDEWSKRDVTPQDLQNDVIKNAVNASVFVNGASGMYLGKFNGTHLIATNYHVVSYPGCPLLSLSGMSFDSFPDIYADLNECMIALKELDLAIIPITLENLADEAKLNGVGTNFAFDKIPVQNTQLLTVGHGLANNPDRNLQISNDNDCRVLSRTGDFRFMDDPDELNPNGYFTWQFSFGCDASHGDSGSGIYDETTGDLIGILSTGLFPMNTRYSNSAALKEASDSNSEDLWKMNLAVPAVKMKEVILQKIAEGQFDQKTVKTLKALLENKAE